MVRSVHYLYCFTTILAVENIVIILENVIEFQESLYFISLYMNI